VATEGAEGERFSWAAEYETAPYASVDKAFEKALRLEAKGEFERAARAVEKSKAGDAWSRKYVAARLYQAAGKTRAWQTRLEEVASSDSPLAPHAALQLAKFHLSRGKSGKVAGLLQTAAKSLSLRKEAALGLASISAARPERAREALVAALEAESDPALRAAMAFSHAGVLEPGRPECKQVLLNQLCFQETPGGGSCKELSNAWGDEYPDVVLLRVLLFGGFSDWARRSAQLERDGRGACFAALMLKGAIARERRRKDDALARFQEAGLCAGSKLRESIAHYFQGRALEALDRDVEALDLYDRLLASTPGFPLERLLKVRGAGIALREGFPLQAQERIESVLTTACAGEDLSTALWLSGFVAWLSGRLDDAGQAFDRLSREYFFAKSSKWVAWGPAALFWKARVFEQAGKEAEANAVHSLLASEAAGTWYGLAARKSLGASYAGVTPSAGNLFSSHLPVPERLALSPEHAAAVELFRLGEWDWAFEELRALTGKGRLAAGATRLMAAAYFRTHPARESVWYRQNIGLLPPPWEGGSRLWYSSLPLSYVAAIEGGSDASGLNPALMAAIIRFESNFNPGVVSSADAVGLLQVKENTGNHVAIPCLGEKRVKVRDLFDPDRNCRLGSIYIAELIRRHNDNWPVALAAYNAGPGTASWWLQRFSGLNTAEFVEQITYPNTVGYVKRIMGIVEPYWSLHFPVLGVRPPEASIPEEIPGDVRPFLDERGGSCQDGRGYQPYRSTAEGDP